MAAAVKGQAIDCSNLRLNRGMTDYVREESGRRRKAGMGSYNWCSCGMRIKGAVLRGLTNLGTAGRCSHHDLVHRRAVVVPMAAATCGKAGFRVR